MNEDTFFVSLAGIARDRFSRRLFARLEGIMICAGFHKDQNTEIDLCANQLYEKKYFSSETAKEKRFVKDIRALKKGLIPIKVKIKPIEEEPEYEDRLDDNYYTISLPTRDPNQRTVISMKDVDISPDYEGIRDLLKKLEQERKRGTSSYIPSEHEM